MPATCVEFRTFLVPYGTTYHGENSPGAYFRRGCVRRMPYDGQLQNVAWSMPLKESRNEHNLQEVHPQWSSGKGYSHPCS